MNSAHPQEPIDCCQPQAFKTLASSPSMGTEETELYSGASPNGSEGTWASQDAPHIPAPGSTYLLGG